MSKLPFTSALALVFSLIHFSLEASTIRFYLDPASPTTGFQPDRNALSDGDNEFRSTFDSRVWFSVDRVAVGAINTDVFDQALPGVEEAHGDVFIAPGELRLNQLAIDEQQLGLLPGFFGDDVDGIELRFRGSREYFSYDFLSLANGGGTGGMANDVFLITLNSLPILYAEGMTDIGLHPDDDLDALALYDQTNPGALNPGADYALFSLDSFSPTVLAGLADPSDVLYTEFDGNWSIWATGPQLGLRADDELDALWVVPEPALHLFVLPIAVFSLAAGRRRKPTDC